MVILALTCTAIGAMFGYVIRAALSGQTYTDEDISSEVDRRAQIGAEQIAAAWYEEMRQQQQWQTFFANHRQSLDRTFANNDPEIARRMNIKAAPRTDREIRSAARGSIPVSRFGIGG